MTDDVDELDDLAAEPDVVDMDDVDEPDYDDDEDTYTAACAGGPYAGRTATSRCPKGFLLVDRPTRRAWLYDFGQSGDVAVFVCRASTAMPLDDDARWRAATDLDYDVIAYEQPEAVPR